MSQHKLRNFLLEGLIATEATSLLAVYSRLLRLAPKAPKNHGRHVLVFPGFLAGDVTTVALRKTLSGLGYQTYGWEIGLNKGPTMEIQAKMEVRLHSLFRLYGKITLVGWSLGGLYARELARRYPEMVRQVITLGTPACHTETSDLLPVLVRLAEAFTGQAIDDLHAGFFKKGTCNPPVPTTAVYSETDGIVSAPLARIHEDRRHQNVKVLATHLGMGVNPGVLWLLADRLAWPVSRWQHFRPPRNLFAKFFPEQKPSL